MLLGPTDYVRFVPNTSFAGTSSGLTFRAWDQTSGTAGGTADTTTNGGTTAFSAGSTQTASIQVGAPPTISGTVADQTTDDHSTIDPFHGVTIGDPNTPALTNLTVTVTLSAAANGTLSHLGGFSSSGGGVYTFTGTAVAATHDLDALVFTPTEHQEEAGTVVFTTFTVAADDHVNPLVSDSTTSVDTTRAATIAPTLEQPGRRTGVRFRRSWPRRPARPQIRVLPLLVAIGPRRSRTSTSTRSKELPSHRSKLISGPGGGTWQYSTDGTNWEAIGSVSQSNALLLVPTDYVRFLPDGVNGNTGSLTVRAWDQTQGDRGHRGQSELFRSLRGHRQRHGRLDGLQHGGSSSHSAIGGRDRARRRSPVR